LLPLACECCAKEIEELKEDRDTMSRRYFDFMGANLLFTAFQGH
jgi:hypothetical protein